MTANPFHKPRIVEGDRTLPRFTIRSFDPMTGRAVIDFDPNYLVEVGGTFSSNDSAMAKKDKLTSRDVIDIADRRGWDCFTIDDWNVLQAIYYGRAF